MRISEVNDGGAPRHSPVRYSDEINDKLIKWMNETGYSIVQVNGQRISTSPHAERRPSRSCEVFVGKIPRDCYEDELFPVFQSAGPIHELRLMMMFSGTNRGYAFVMYERLEDARRAVDHLDNFELRRGHRVGVLPCVNNCRLFVGCFEADERLEAQLQKVLRAETEHVVSVARRGGRNGRWYFLVEYATHRAAAIARRELTPRRQQLFGPRVIVDWEIPLDKRGRKLALDQRRALKGPAVVKLCKPVMTFPFPEAKANGKLKYFEGNGTKCSQPMCVAQSNSSSEVWLQKQTPTPEPYFWPTDLLQDELHGQYPSAEWNTGATSVRRPLTRQSSLDQGSRSNFSQDSDYNSFHSSLYRQLITSSQQNVKRSLDSSLYSDPDSHRPLSSDSSSGSARSSFSMSAGSCVSNWDGSAASSASTGSGGNSCSVNWNRSLSHDIDSELFDSRSRLMINQDFFMPESHPQSLAWCAEDQQSYFPTELNKNGIWSTRFQSQEDHDLIDDLFMNEDGALHMNADQGMNLHLFPFALPCTGESSKKNFDRAVQPPQQRVPSREAIASSNFKKGF